MFFNPANTYFLNENNLFASHSSYFEGLMSYDIAAANFSINNRIFAAGILMNSISDIPLTRDMNISNVPDSLIFDYNKIKFETWREIAFFLNYSTELPYSIKGGVNFKLIYKGIESYSAYGLGFDLGFTYLNKAFIHSFVVKNITTTPLFWSTGDNEIIIPNIVIGNSYVKIFDSINSRLTLSADVDIFLENRKTADQFNAGSISFNIHGGAELLIKDKLAVRLGTDSGEMTYGAGIRIKSFNIDYALLQNSDLENSHKISLIYKWGGN